MAGSGSQDFQVSAGSSERGGYGTKEETLWPFVIWLWTSHSIISVIFTALTDYYDPKERTENLVFSTHGEMVGRHTLDSGVRLDMGVKATSTVFALCVTSEKVGLHP